MQKIPKQDENALGFMFYWELSFLAFFELAVFHGMLFIIRKILADKLLACLSYYKIISIVVFCTFMPMFL